MRILTMLAAAFGLALINDGDVLCSLGELKLPIVHGWDARISTEAGFGPPIARDATEKDLTITMAVTNLGRTTRNSVRLGRYFGRSPNRQSNSPNNANTTSDSVFLWDNPHQGFVDSPVYRVMLTAL